MFPHRVYWYIENKILYVHFRGTIHLPDLIEATQQTLNLLDAALNDNIHVLVSLTEVPELGVALNDLFNNPMGRTFYNHPRLGWTIYCGGAHSELFQFIVSSIAKQINAPIRWYDHEAEAIAFLNELPESHKKE